MAIVLGAGIAQVIMAIVLGAGIAPTSVDIGAATAGYITDRRRKGDARFGLVS
jgi:hypothetical protein